MEEESEIGVAVAVETVDRPRATICSFTAFATILLHTKLYMFRKTRWLAMPILVFIPIPLAVGERRRTFSAAVFLRRYHS